MSPIEYLKDRNSDSVILSPLHSSEVNKVILNLDLSKSIRPNGVPIKLLKILVPEISCSLAIMITQSFSKGIFPSNLKLVKVIAICKGVPELSSNYEPVSLLPILVKFMKSYSVKEFLLF